MKVGDNIDGDEDQSDIQPYLDCLEAIEAYRQRETARIAQAIRVASLTEQEALRLVVLRRRGFGAYEAVEIIIAERGK